MENPSSRKQPKKKPNNQLLRYTGLAFQMMTTLALAVFAGYKIDQRTGWRLPVFLIIFSLLAIGILLWQITKDTRKDE